MRWFWRCSTPGSSEEGIAHFRSPSHPAMTPGSDRSWVHRSAEAAKREGVDQGNHPGGVLHRGGRTALESGNVRFVCATPWRGNGTHHHCRTGQGNSTSGKSAAMVLQKTSGCAGEFMDQCLLTHLVHDGRNVA